MKTFKRFAVAGVLSALVLYISPSAALQPERLKEIAVVCAQCHGVDGIGVAPNIPNLAGQVSLYMENQLEQFRHKPARELERYQLHIRDSHIMDSQSARFDAGELAALSRYFSDMRCAADDRPVVATASIRCGECHGDDGISRMPDAPNLAGQKEPYLLAQLKALKAATLKHNKVIQGQPDVTERGTARRYHRTMGQWAARLSEPEMVLAAKYYSGLPGIWVCK